jgi:hypothetical protein
VPFPDIEINCGFARETEAREIEDGVSAVPCGFSGMLKMIPAEALVCDVVCVGGKAPPLVPEVGFPATGFPLQAEIAIPDSKKASACLTSITLGTKARV